jgi:hypothetical protein
VNTAWSLTVRSARVRALRDAQLLVGEAGDADGGGQGARELDAVDAEARRTSGVP